MSLRYRTLIAGLVLCLSAVACATAGANTRSGSRADVITAEEARATNQTNAYEVVRAERPNWLRRRGTQSITRAGGDIVIYVDATRMGGPESLRGVPISAITSIQYFDPTSAVQRWGTDHGFGAIVVSTQ